MLVSSNIEKIQRIIQFDKSMLEVKIMNLCHFCLNFIINYDILPENYLFISGTNEKKLD